MAEGKYSRETVTKKRAKRVTETSDYVAFTKRTLWGLGVRIGQDPAALANLRELQQTMVDAVNHGIFTANRDSDHYSQNDMAAILGTSRQAIAKRIKLGEEVHVRLQSLRADGALVRIADVRAERARGLAAAAVEDSTGSVRELGALRATGS